MSLRPLDAIAREYAGRPCDIVYVAPVTGSRQPFHWDGSDLLMPNGDAAYLPIARVIEPRWEVEGVATEDVK